MSQNSELNASITIDIVKNIVHSVPIKQKYLKDDKFLFKLSGNTTNIFLNIFLLNFKKKDTVIDIIQK